MDVKIGHLSPEEASEFVSAWIGPGDPTGLIERSKPLDKPISPLEVEEVQEPRELVLARESANDKE